MYWLILVHFRKIAISHFNRPPIWSIFTLPYLLANTNFKLHEVLYSTSLSNAWFTFKADPAHILLIFWGGASPSSMILLSSVKEYFLEIALYTLVHTSLKTLDIYLNSILNFTSEFQLIHCNAIDWIIFNSSHWKSLMVFNRVDKLIGIFLCHLQWSYDKGDCSECQVSCHFCIEKWSR